MKREVFWVNLFIAQGFTYTVRAHFLEDVLEMTGYKMTSFNQIDDYGQEKMWKTQKQLAPRKRKNQITALVEVWSYLKNLALIYICTSLNDVVAYLSSWFYVCLSILGACYSWKIDLFNLKMYGKKKLCNIGNAAQVPKMLWDTRDRHTLAP